MLIHPLSAQVLHVAHSYKLCLTLERRSTCCQESSKGSPIATEAAECAFEPVVFQEGTLSTQIALWDLLQLCTKYVYNGSALGVVTYI